MAQLTDYLTLPATPTQAWWHEHRTPLVEYAFEVITVLAAVELADPPGRALRERLRRSHPVKMPQRALYELPPGMPEPVRAAFGELQPWSGLHMFDGERMSTALGELANGEFRHGWWGLVAETDWVVVLVSNWDGGYPPR